MNHSTKFLGLVALALGLAGTSSAAVETYSIDSNHSSVGFSIRHFVSKVPGRFTKFDGTILVDRANLEKSSVTATIDIASVDTAQSDRDADLKTAAFFDAAKYPTMTFKSKAWKKTGENKYDVAGDLTIKNITKPVVLKVESLGFGDGSNGAKLSGWEATTTVKKSDFDVKGPAILGAMLGDEVAISITIEAKLTK